MSAQVVNQVSDYFLRRSNVWNDLLDEMCLKNNIKFYLHFSIQGILSKDDEGGRCWCFNGRMFLLSFYFYFNDWLVDVLPTKTKLNFFSLFIEVRSFF